MHGFNCVILESTLLILLYLKSHPMKLKLIFKFMLITLMFVMIACKPVKYVGKESKKAVNDVKKEL